MAIQGIIWDFGNVFAGFDHHIACNRLSAHSTASPMDIYGKLFASSRGTTTLRKLFEIGRFSGEEFFALARELIPLSDDLTFQSFCEIWKDVLWENEGISEVIDRVRPEIKQCILSNTDPIHWLGMEQLQVTKKHFSNPSMLVRSYTSGVRKPHPKIYHDALRCFGGKVRDIGLILYVDDIPEYCEAFMRMGGVALVYNCSQDSLIQLEEALNRLGVFQN